MTMRIYVGTYAKYNEGSIQGEWLDLEDYTDKEEFYKACHELHDDEEDPEFMFQDHEGIPDSMVSESHVDESVWELMAAYAEHDEGAVNAYCSIFGQWDADDYLDRYYGQYESDTALAEEYIEATGMLSDLPENLQVYFDYESFGRDLAMDFSEDSGYYFHNY